MRWGLKSTSKFFRIIYCGRLWLTRMEAEQVVFHGWNLLASLLQMSDPKQLNLRYEYKIQISRPSARIKEAYGGSARLSSMQKWALFYMRPKIHMMCHLVMHVCKLLWTCATVHCQHVYGKKSQTKKRCAVRAGPGGCMDIKSSKPGPYHAWFDPTSSTQKPRDRFQKNAQV